MFDLNQEIIYEFRLGSEKVAEGIALYGDVILSADILAMSDRPLNAYIATLDHRSSVILNNRYQILSAADQVKMRSCSARRSA